MKPNFRASKKKLPAEFTKYLLSGIRAIREAATSPAANGINKKNNSEKRELAHE